MLDTTQAHNILYAILQQRKQKRASANHYQLDYTNRIGEVQGSMSGGTISDLVKEFKANGGAYRYAFIFRKKDGKLMRGLDKKLSRGFVRMT